MSSLYKLAIVLLAVITFSGCGQEQQQQQTIPEQPNIIFIFSDDHASHSISAYGSELMETPNLDRLADEGMKFRKAFVTNSICAPARAVLLTGKHSHLNGQLTNGQRFDGEQLTYPKLLQEAGYRTAMIGKWHLRSDPTGYDYWDVLPGQGSYYNPDFRTAEGEHQVEGYVTDIITDKVIGWIDENRESGQPFMVNYHHKAPHRNWMPGPDHLTLFEGVELPEPETLYANWSGELPGQEIGDHPEGEWTGRTSAVRDQEMTLMNHFSRSWDLKFPPEMAADEGLSGSWANTYARFTDEQREAWDRVYDRHYEEFAESDLQGEELLAWIYQRYMKDYLGTIASVDDNLGRLLDYLEETGLDENTIVVYASDQGFYLGDHGWYDKRWMYEESLHIPFMIRWPGVIEPGSTNDDLVQNIDFAPTLVDIAGVEVPDDMQGRSLLPLLAGQSADDWRESIYYHYYEMPGAHNVARHYGVRTEDYKLIHYYQIDEWELFDLKEDPNEMQSVYDDPEYATIQEELEAELERLREKYQVPEVDPV